MHGATDHMTRFDRIETLTDRVMNWYGFTYASDYRMRPYAMLAAIQLHEMGVSPDTLTTEQIKAADKEAGGTMLAMWNALAGTNTDVPGPEIKPDGTDHG